MRTIIIGDIHACYDELRALIDKTALSLNDHVIATGDLVCKGPSSVKTLDLLMSLPNFSAVMGNHDYYLVKNWRAGCLEKLTGSHAEAVEEMGSSIDRYMKFLEKLPYYIELPECTIVHAGVKPGIPLNKQDPDDLLHLRELSAGLPWYAEYKNPKLIVFGHWAKRGLVIRENAIGLDTGCVYGGKLTACVLPGRQIVSVDAKKNYSPAKG